MIVRDNPLVIVVCLFVGLMISELSAHQKKEAVTRIIFNHRTQSIEVIHRFLLHDAEHAAKILFGKSTDIIDNKSSQQQFSNYVVEQFNIAGTSGEKLPLATVGFEVEGKYIWIYQETDFPYTKPLSKLVVPSSLSITNTALTEIWDQQVNLINVEYDKKVRSLVFSGSMSAQSIKLD